MCYGTARAFREYGRLIVAHCRHCDGNHAGLVCHWSVKEDKEAKEIAATYLRLFEQKFAQS